jgi:hypothetical protein
MEHSACLVTLLVFYDKEGNSYEDFATQIDPIVTREGFRTFSHGTRFETLHRSTYRAVGHNGGVQLSGEPPQLERIPAEVTDNMFVPIDITIDLQNRLNQPFYRPGDPVPDQGVRGGIAIHLIQNRGDDYGSAIVHLEVIARYGPEPSESRIFDD